MARAAGHRPPLLTRDGPTTIVRSTSDDHHRTPVLSSHHDAPRAAPSPIAGPGWTHNIGKQQQRR